jgi:Rps23 Pro-64 3,4-dihydroxylase Tpa1-like proline 4-hydroxylase
MSGTCIAGSVYGLPQVCSRSRVLQLARQYQMAVPFPHIHFDCFLNPPTAAAIAREFPDYHSPAWIRYKHANENKSGLSQRELFPPQIGELVDQLSSEIFVSWLRKLTGIPDLIADPSLEGGGLHQSSRGGFLNVHTDFSVHHYHPEWERRVNLILYLNPEWRTSWGGALEFWERDMKHCAASYVPLLNHAVIFDTDRDSLHGFPDPLQCPEGIYRKSLALYYYTVSGGAGSTGRPTQYRPRPDDGLFKSAMMRLDSWGVALYSRAKRRFGFSDRIASKVLSIFSKT